ncbi:transposase (plasmid) [Ensifer adhaerens]|uniref:transposase n=1 Tax=Ensifer adhaerens TaxID=106592 RepID=UPI0023A957DE|nr:transposase [Ensifer adhaerens]WDZ81963.1 transposase [Ensifer adhaerens]
MPEENIAAVSMTDEGAPAKAPERKKRNAPKRQGATPGPARTPSKASTENVTATKTRFGAEEKQAKLAFIEAQVAGASTLKDAVKSAGISEQTYYNWKNSVKPDRKPSGGSLSASDGFAELVEIEAENQRLRKLLAERLRAENADLRKKLGLD